MDKLSAGLNTSARTGEVLDMFFFAESDLAETHRRDIILYALRKKSTCVTAGSFPWRGREG